MCTWEAEIGRWLENRRLGQPEELQGLESLTKITMAVSRVVGLRRQASLQVETGNLVGLGTPEADREASGLDSAGSVFTSDCGYN